MIRSKRFDRHVDGILLLDKPQGLSSNAALQQVRGLYRALKAGHAGSLDPLATGMLPICFGQATKVCDWLLDSRKTYRVTAALGRQTDSADADGAIIAEAPVPALSEALLREVLTQFLGEQLQVPPMFSALKHQGRRLYELARRGEAVARAPRKITIERIELSGYTSDEVQFEVRCSKGTYIRSLVEDVAKKLGTLGHVAVLRRVEVEPFGAGPVYTVEALQSSEPAALQALLLPADSALIHLPRIDLEPGATEALSHGRTVTVPPGAPEPGPARAYGEGRFLGVVELRAGLAKPRRLFV